MQSLKEISCDPVCGFMIRSHEEREVLDGAVKHVKHAHPDMKLTEKDIKTKMKTVK
ncbi:DUF1059 domain-containing protein [Candidatus Pacearchaeota archaeon]|nr:DUF1059 domain-containing protein [Candidatus Pacearchaeota archaeon]